MTIASLPRWMTNNNRTMPVRQSLIRNIDKIDEQIRRSYNMISIFRNVLSLLFDDISCDCVTALYILQNSE